MSPFDDLRRFLGGWFHQDFDLEGGEVDRVVAALLATDASGERSRVADDIRRFLDDHPGRADRAFREVLDPDVDPGGWGLDAREFLTRIEDGLREAS